MPIPNGTPLMELPHLIAPRVAIYNAPRTPTALYNAYYGGYILLRTVSIARHGSLYGWIYSGTTAPAIWGLLNAFGMNSQRSRLVLILDVERALRSRTPQVIDWLAQFNIPLQSAPADTPGPRGNTLAVELSTIYDYFATPGIISENGGYVIASKTMHCLFPGLAPMIDGTHTGPSYHNIQQTTYLPPAGYTWTQWLGAAPARTLNPSPRGAGRQAWGIQQFLAAIGVNQSIYEHWQNANGNRGLATFLALDPSIGTTGVPRIIDKVLW